MKDNYIIAIGDIHGRTNWEWIVEAEKDADKIVFVGDYADSFDISVPWQIANLQKILKFKADHPEQVVLLMGNHDFHYIVDSERYSGYSHEYASRWHDIFIEALEKKQLQMAYQNGEYLFTHAGVTETWLKNYKLSTLAAKPLDLAISDLFYDDPSAFEYDRRDSSGYGENKIQSPIWVRPDSLTPDMIEGYTQVVGHTQQKTIKYDGDLILIDTCNKEYLRINDGKTSTVLCE